MDIQITEEMLDAGLDWLVGYDPGWEDPMEFLANVYRAMREAEGSNVEPKLA